jgi:hypothetical protein
MPVGIMRSELYGGGVKSGQARNRNLILPGRCGFRGCNESRIGGEWKQGGSYMCPEHFERLLPVRILWDKTSPQANAYVKRMGLDRQEALRELKYEENKEHWTGTTV